MRLNELFDNNNPQMSIANRLKQAALDIITPLLAHRVPFITVQNVIDELRDTRSGIVVDRSLVMKLLNPMKVKAVSKIEGDRIYLSPPDEGPAAQNSKDEAENNIQNVKDKAIKQAKSRVTDKT